MSEQKLTEPTLKNRPRPLVQLRGVYMKQKYEEWFERFEKKFRGFDVQAWLFKKFPYYLYSQRYFQEKQRVLAILEKFVSEEVLGEK